jgi:hypothetical protein
MCEPMGRREIFLTFSLLVEIEGHFTNEFVSYVYETEDWAIRFSASTFVAPYCDIVAPYLKFTTIRIKICGSATQVSIVL